MMALKPRPRTRTEIIALLDQLVEDTAAAVGKMREVLVEERAFQDDEEAGDDDA